MHQGRGPSGTLSNLYIMGQAHPMSPFPSQVAGNKRAAHRQHLGTGQLLCEDIEKVFSGGKWVLVLPQSSLRQGGHNLALNFKVNVKEKQV